jgi:hypothetical protein
VDQKERRRRRALRDAEAAEARDRRSQERQERWRREGMYISWDEYAADPTIACRGCGLPLNDHGGGWSPTQQMDPDQRAAHEAAEATWQERHASCRDDTASLHFRWGIAGSRTEHCMDCCPPPPMSPEQTKQVAGILANILANATDRSDLDVWRLTLSCGHLIEQTAHRSHDRFTTSVHDCPECQQRRAHIAAERLGPATVASEHRVDARQAREVEAAQTELRRAEARLAKAQERVAKVQNSPRP